MSGRGAKPFEAWQKRRGISVQPTWMLPILAWYHATMAPMSDGTRYEFHAYSADKFARQYRVEMALRKMEER